MASNPTGSGAAPPGSVPPGGQPGSSTVPNTTWNNPATANFRHPQTPFKPVGSGWDHVRYVPPWTDPDWHDDGREREQTDFKIRDFFDRLRPAVHPKDQYRRPTKYAQRFSIFPGRLDGRSRTSPTRADSRQLFPATGDIRTGKDLFDGLDYSAAQRGQHIDEYMASSRPDMQQGTETEQRCMQQYEDLIIDENWQSILFGNLTMDEVSASRYPSSLCLSNGAFRSTLKSISPWRIYLSKASLGQSTRKIQPASFETPAEMYQACSIETCGWTQPILEKTRRNHDMCTTSTACVRNGIQG